MRGYTISDDELAVRLRNVLKGADLETTTEKAIRKTLETQLGVSLEDRKPFIRAQVEQYLQQEDNLRQQQASAAPSAGIVPAYNAVNMAAPCILSPALAGLLGQSEMSREEVVNRLWAHIASRQLQRGKDIILDPILSVVFQPPLDAFTMNQQLSAHLFPKPMDMPAPLQMQYQSIPAPEQPPAKKLKQMEREAKAAEKKAAAKAKKEEEERLKKAGKKPKRKAKPIKDPNAPKKPLTPYVCFVNKRRPLIQADNPEASFADIGRLLGEEWRGLSTEQRDEYVQIATVDKARYEEDMKSYQPMNEADLAKLAHEKKMASGVQKQMVVSEALSKFFGGDVKTMSRPEVVRRMWAYFTEKNLKDPNDKRWIISDEPLKELLELERFRGFSLMKLISPHLSPPDGDTKGDEGDGQTGDNYENEKGEDSGAAEPAE